MQRNWIKRSIAIILAVIMVVGIGVLSACGKEDETSTKTTASASKVSVATTAATKTTAAKTAVSSVAATTAVTAAATTVVAAATTIKEELEPSTGKGVLSEIASEVEVAIGSDILEEDEIIDLGGITITGVTWSAVDILRDTDDAGIRWVYLYRRMKEAEKKYNFKFEQVATTQAIMIQDLTANVLAGTKYHDIIAANSIIAFPSWVKSKLILPLDEYIDWEAPILKACSGQYYGTIWQGKHYGLLRDYETAYPDVYFNKTLLEREGQPDILDLVESKTWTWNEFLNIAIKCTKDTNGDGIIDQWGIVASQSRLVIELLHSNGLSAGVALVNDVPAFNLDSGPALRALQFAVDLAYYHKVLKIQSGNTPSTYTNGMAAFYLNEFWYNRLILNMGVDSGLAPLPMGPDVSSYQNMAQCSFETVSATCEHPKEVARIYQEVLIQWDENLNSSAEYQTLLNKLPYDWNWSNDNSGFRKVSTEREYNLSMKSLYPLFRTDYSLGYKGLYNGLNILGKGFTNMLNGLMSVNQLTDSVKYEVEDIISQFK